MGGSPASDIRRAFEERASRGEEALFRALVAHPSWLVPAEAAASLSAEGVTARMAYFGDDPAFPAGELWIFSEAAVASRASARGAPLGTYVADVHGEDLFGRIAHRFRAVRVDPEGEGSPGGWLRGAELESLRVAAGEHAIEGLLPHAGAPLLASQVRRLRAYAGFLVLRVEGGGLLTRPVPGGDDVEAIVAFTAEDCFKTFVACLAPEEAANLVLERLTGAALASRAAASDAVGVVFNIAGPGRGCFLSRDRARILAG